MCYSAWGYKELDTIYQLKNNNNLEFNVTINRHQTTHTQVKDLEQELQGENWLWL